MHCCRNNSPYKYFQNFNHGHKHLFATLHCLISKCHCDFVAVQSIKTGYQMTGETSFSWEKPLWCTWTNIPWKCSRNWWPTISSPKKKQMEKCKLKKLNSTTREEQILQKAGKEVSWQLCSLFVCFSVELDIAQCRCVRHLLHTKLHCYTRPRACSIN